MATKYKERLVKLRSTACPGITYFTKRNKKKLSAPGAKLTLNKYCSITRKHEEFREVK